MHRTCLIAAHDPWFIQLLRIFSEEFGFEVAEAFDGQSVLSRITEDPPAVLLLQMDLPGPVSGPEILKAVSGSATRRPAVRKIPVIVFTWHGIEQEAVAGAAAQLTEPVTYQAFTDALAAAGMTALSGPVESAKADARHSPPALRRREK